MELRTQFLDALYTGQPFRAIVRDLGLTPNQVWGLTKTDDEWRIALETAAGEDLQQGTNAAYVRGCVCGECREWQRQRMARNGVSPLSAPAEVISSACPQTSASACRGRYLLRCG